MKQIKFVIWGLAISLIGICTIQAEEKTGFKFAGGNAESGSEIFVTLSCIQCHSVKGVHFEEPKDRRINLQLGGEDLFVKNYEDIMKAISNPKHVIREKYAHLMTPAELGELLPFMEDFTGKMTLKQFIDLVTFLDKVYSKSIEGYGKQ